MDVGIGRLSHMECCPASCPSGHECQNQAMRRQQGPRTRRATQQHITLSTDDSATLLVNVVKSPEQSLRQLSDLSAG